jgi:cytochrome c peroxidase
MRRPVTILKSVTALLFLTGGVLMNAPWPVYPNVEAAPGSRAPGFEPRLPDGIPAELWRRFIPANNPLTPEKVQLGQALYFDKRLSADGSISCATCHDPSAAFADHNPRSVGIGGRTGTRNAPTTLNAMFSESLFWDGRVRTLEEQVRQPLVNPSEMGMPNFEAVVERLSAVPEYRRRFRRVFKGEGITIETIAKAIATFERTRLSGDSPFDRFIAGGADALSEPQKRGWELFRGKAQCVNCHAFSPSSPFFTDFKFYNTGVATKGKDFGRLARGVLLSSPPGHDADRALNSLAHVEGFSELGRYLVTGRTKDIGAFKTPTLRDVELTAPYMHDGSLKTLLDVVRFYDRGGEHNPHLDERVRPLGLTAQEMSDLVDFMRALTSDEVLRQAMRATPQTRTPVPVPAIKQVAPGEN